MPPIHDDAICLRHREWSETSQTVTLLSRAHGLVHGLAKGSQREKAPFSGGFEHLQLGELGFISKPDRDLVILTEWDLIDPFPLLRADYRAATRAMFAAEVTAGLLAPLDPHPTVFAALHALLARPAAASPDATDTDGIGPARPLAAYLDTLLADTGHAVVPEEPPGSDEEIWAFDPAQSLFRPDPGRELPADLPFEPTGPTAGVWHLRGETLRALLALREAAASGGPIADDWTGRQHPNSGGAWTRAARFLGACACYRASRRPASLEAFLRVTRS